MTDTPVFQSKRLLLRELSLKDASEIQPLLNDETIAMNTLTIPFPLPDGWAKQWIEALVKVRVNGNPTSFSIVRNSTDEIVGVVSLRDVNTNFENAELAYWIGRPFRGRGFATEAGRLIMALGFQTLGLNRIYAYHYSSNKGSGRVLIKLGMTHEGTLRQHIKKSGKFKDTEIYGILCSEFSRN